MRTPYQPLASAAGRSGESCVDLGKVARGVFGVLFNGHVFFKGMSSQGTSGSRQQRLLTAPPQTLAALFEMTDDVEPLQQAGLQSPRALRLPDGRAKQHFARYCPNMLFFVTRVARSFRIGSSGRAGIPWPIRYLPKVQPQRFLVCAPRRPRTPRRGTRRRGASGKTSCSWTPVFSVLAPCKYLSRYLFVSSSARRLRVYRRDGQKHTGTTARKKGKSAPVLGGREP